jgi:hypothetical protein
MAMRLAIFGLAEQHHAAGVAAEARDVVPHPLQRENQVEQADIAGRRIVGAGEMREEEMTEGGETMVQRHHHHIAAPAQPRAVIERPRARAVAVFAAVDVDHHRSPAAVGEAAGPDVQIETVL